MAKIVRLACDRDKSFAPLIDINTSEPAFINRGNDVTFELGLFSNGSLVTGAGLTDKVVWLEVKTKNDPTLVAQLSGNDATPNESISLGDWKSQSSQTAKISFTKAQTAAMSAGDLWLVVFVANDDAPDYTEQVTYAAAKLKVYEDGADFPTVPIAEVDRFVRRSELGAGLQAVGEWDASTNTPNLTALTPDIGDFYVVTTPGTNSITGTSESWDLGDRAVYTESGWIRSVIDPDLYGPIALGVADPTVTGVVAPIGTEGYTNEAIPRFFKKVGPASTDWALVRTSNLEACVYVKDFGAKGDGVTDDTAAIQAAVATGKNVVLGQGAFNFTINFEESIQLQSNQTFDFAGGKISCQLADESRFSPLFLIKDKSKVFILNADVEWKSDFETIDNEATHFGLSLVYNHFHAIIFCYNSQSVTVRNCRAYGSDDTKAYNHFFFGHSSEGIFINNVDITHYGSGFFFFSSTNRCKGTITNVRCDKQSLKPNIHYGPGHLYYGFSREVSISNVVDGGTLLTYTGGDPLDDGHTIKSAENSATDPDSEVDSVQVCNIISKRAAGALSVLGKHNSSVFRDVIWRYRGTHPGITESGGKRGVELVGDTNGTPTNVSFENIKIDISDGTADLPLVFLRGIGIKADISVFMASTSVKTKPVLTLSGLKNSSVNLFLEDDTNTEANQPIVLEADRDCRKNTIGITLGNSRNLIRMFAPKFRFSATTSGGNLSTFPINNEINIKGLKILRSSAISYLDFADDTSLSETNALRIEAENPIFVRGRVSKRYSTLDGIKFALPRGGESTQNAFVEIAGLNGTTSGFSSLYYATWMNSSPTSRYLAQIQPINSSLALVKITANFTGGSKAAEPVRGDILTGATSGAKAEVFSVTTSGGTWAGADASGSFDLTNILGSFQNGETVNIDSGGSFAVSSTSTPTGVALSMDASGYVTVSGYAFEGQVSVLPMSPTRD